MSIVRRPPVRLAQAVLPAMRQRGSGTIVQMSSMGGQLAPPGFGASRMHRFSPVIDDYTLTVGPTRAAVDAMDGSQPGDPNRAAAAIIEIVNATRAPLRLALGDDAVDSIRAKHEQLSAELRRWDSLSRSTALADLLQ